ncbi:MAG: nucleotidyltransferase family protein [bacterium]|nr:nucleotidyltransferase family protein [bacterium]
MSILEIKEKISPILRAYGIKKASIFGSVSRGDDRPDSDVDLLVELGPGPMGLIKFIGLKHKLEDTLGKNVDLVTEGNINRHLEPYIRPELKQIYEE